MAQGCITCILSTSDCGVVFPHWAFICFENDQATMREVVEQAKGRPGFEDGLMALAADTEAFHGRFRKAHELDRQTCEAAERADGKDPVPGYMTSAAWREAEGGNVALARQRMGSRPESQ